MDKMSAKKKAAQFLHQKVNGEVTLTSISVALCSQGYTIIEYNNIINDEDVATVIEE